MDRRSFLKTAVTATVAAGSGLAQDGANSRRVADGTEQKPTNLAPAVGGGSETAGTEGNPFGIRRGGPGVPRNLKPEWENCTLMVTEIGGGRGGGSKSKYVLTKDGKQLTIYQESSGGMGDSEKRLVFDKQ
jgi:hypothetical protein